MLLYAPNYCKNICPNRNKCKNMDPERRETAIRNAARTAFQLEDGDCEDVLGEAVEAAKTKQKTAINTCMARTILHYNRDRSRKKDEWPAAWIS